ncbi:MAG: UvrD-helicase domain-containing protein, partial [Balneolaceae bacterium]
MVTYTEAATKELRDRLMRRLRESLNVLQNQSPPSDDPFLCELLEWTGDYESAVQNLERAIRNFDESAISTIHGFCYNVLSDRAFLSNSIYDMEMIGDDSELIQEAVDDFWRKWIAESSADFKKETLAEFIISRGYNPQVLAEQLTTAIGKPYLKWIPKKNPTPDLEKNIGRLKDQFAELQEVWETDSTEIQQLLFHDGLNGNKYRKTSIPEWIRQMQEMLEGEIPPIDLFEKFEKFTSTIIGDSLTKEGEKNPPKHPFFNLCDEYQSIAERLKNYETTFKKYLLEYLIREVPRKKRDKEVLSYDDMLINLQQALRHEESGDKLKKVLRRQYPLALVDEFQDTDPVQYDIFRSIYGEEEGQRGLFMIGDPKQSIYSFRGADVFAYLSARRDADNDRVYGLSHNFRSVPLLIEAVNNVFQTGHNPFVFENIHFEPSKPGREEQDYGLLTENNRPVRPMVLQYWPADRQKRLNKGTARDHAAAVTAAEIYRLISNGEAGTCKIGDKNLRASDVAVLVRKHHEADLMRDALEEYNIKSVQFSQESVFASDEAEQLEIILQAVAEPSREVSVRAALASPLMGRTAAYIDACNSDEELWLRELNRFSSLHRAWNTHGFAYMFRTLLYDEKVAQHVIRQPRGERILTNLIHLGELIQQKEKEAEEGIRNMLKWLAKKRQEDSSQKDEEQIRLESDERLVKIVTMHKSKGLQYPVVFCPFLWSGPNLKEDGKPLVFHKPEENYQAFIDLQAKDSDTRSYHRYLAEREELAESMRLAYVALTRAEHRCYLSWFPAGSSIYSALGCLMAGSERVLDALKEKTGYGKSSSSIPLERVEKELKALAERSPELFDLQEIEPGPGTGEKGTLQSSGSTTGLQHRTVSRQGPLPLKNHIASFSSLTRYKAEAEDPLY